MSEKRKRNQRGKVTFNKNWLSDERFKLWFQKSKGKHKAICKLCNYAVIDIVVMGVSALASHAKGTKHQGKVKAFKPISELFYKTSTSITTWSASSTNSSVASSGSSSTNQSNNLSTNQSRVHTFMSSLSVTPAEIQWVMKMFMSHSFRFCLDLNELLKAMFPDSQIAKLFRLSKTKCSYYLVFGLAPLKKL